MQTHIRYELKWNFLFVRYRGRVAARTASESVGAFLYATNDFPPFIMYGRIVRYPVKWEKLLHKPKIIRKNDPPG